MEELVKLLGQKFGLKDDTAKQVVTTVADFLKKKLPPALAGQIDGLLAGGTADLQGIAKVAKGLGGLLGGKKD
jgi:actin-like ATPase involved in cell morphogenesis